MDISAVTYRLYTDVYFRFATPGLSHFFARHLKQCKEPEDTFKLHETISYYD